jgi:HSP20 family protein
MMSMSGDLWGEMARLQRELDQLFRPGGSSGIRAMSRHNFPAINVGSTPDAIEVLALAPGMESADFEVSVDKGLLVISGGRKSELPQKKNHGQDIQVYAQERFSGGFKRVVSLPDDVDGQRVEASCKDGLLHIRVPRLESARPRRIDVH